MSRRAEDKIRSLVVELVNAADDEKQLRTIAELRTALRQHMKEMRARLSGYPFVPERRQHQTETTARPPTNAPSHKKNLSKSNRPPPPPVRA